MSNNPELDIFTGIDFDEFAKQSITPTNGGATMPTAPEATQENAVPTTNKEDVTEMVNETMEQAQKQAEAPAPSQGVVGAPANVASNRTALIQSGLQKLRSIEREMNLVLFEREDEIKSIILGLMTGKHVLLLGPPGTGKSYLSRELQKHISNANYFEWLLNRTSDPSELLGPVSVKAMEHDQFLRKPDGKLPEAHIAFLDEIFKSNSATLNILLSLLNEKVWFNDGVPVKANLLTAVGASNEFPEDEELDAFFDRFLFRHWVEYVGDSGNQFDMLKNAAELRAGKLNPTYTQITLEEIQAVQSFVNEDIMPADHGIQALQKLHLELKKKEISISDRRLVTCVQIMQANAALGGRTAIDADDMEHLAFVLWERKEDIEDIKSEVTKMMNPYKDKLNTAFREAQKVKDEVLATKDKTDRANKAIDARNVLEKIVKRIDAVAKDAGKAGRDVTEFNAKSKQVQDMINEIVQVCLFNMTAGDSMDPSSLPF